MSAPPPPRAGAAAELAPPPACFAESACWPDAVAPRRAVLDDVSRLNAAEAGAVVQPRTLADVQAALALARATGRRVVMRGTKHSMGGQSLCDDAVALDMAFVNAVRYDAATNTYRAGAGATWADVITVLNAHGRAPRTLQSYATFSVGGTLSVNGHGITSDFCVAESVLSFTLVRADGSVVEVSRDNEHRELFGLVLGGYGLFGVLFDATMRCEDNSRLALDVLSVSVADFTHVYDSLLAIDEESGGAGSSGSGGAGDEVVTKLARLDATTLATAEVFIFRRASPAVTVSALPLKPREMSLVTRLLYKWIAGPLREARYALEHELGVALDWQPVSDRNSMVFESAATLVRLYSPLVSVDDTFILQEFFVPRACFSDFVAGARGPLVYELPKENLVTLLNISIRFVRQDVDTALPYACHVGGSFAFVFYYRMRRSAEADAVLRRYHTMLAAVALKLGGTFYLPYRLHYSDVELHAAYPGFRVFCARKAAHDAGGLFSNRWWERYGENVEGGESEGGGESGEPGRGAAATALRTHSPSPTPAAATTAVEAAGRAPALGMPPLLPALGMPPLLPALRARREGSFRALFRDAALRSAFLEGFLVDVFAVVPAAQMLRILSLAVWDARNKSDTDIYCSLQKQIELRGSPLSKLSGLWAGIKQLSAQRAELVRETVSVLARLGKIGVTHSYCSIGDHGKLVLALREALGMQGRAWVAHDVDAKEEDVSACLERGANDGREVGEFVSLDYANLPRASTSGLLAAIPSGACDLVTLNQGLHHLVPGQVPNLLAAVRRVLRPGGVFIIREHDLDKECHLLPMLDCAHMVFNAVTGVRVEIERQELRCFRPLAHWREIVVQAGFADAQIYELQPHDPTIDVMLSFTKPFESAGPEAAAPFPGASRPSQARGAAVAAQLVMNSLPGLAIEGATSALETVLRALPRLRTQLHALVAAPRDAAAAEEFPPAVRAAAELFVEKYLDPAFMMLSRLRPLAAVALPVSESRKDLLLPSEIFLLEATVRRRAAEGGKVEGAIVALFERIVAMTKEVRAPQAAAAAAAADTPPAAEAEARALIEQLISAIPALCDPDALLGRVGLSPKAEGIARALLASFVKKGGSDKAAAARALALTLDEQGRAELLAALPGLLAERKPPHMLLLLQKHSPWRAAALAVLGCPAVERPSRTQALFAQVMGLGPILQLQQEAQALRRPPASAAGAGAGAGAGTGAGAGAGASYSAKPSPAAINSALLSISPIMEYEGDRQDIGSVLAVISASLELRSGTGLFAPVVTDVTEQARALLNPTTGLLALSQLEAPAVLRIGRRIVSVRYRALPGVAPPGGKARIGELSRALAAAGMLDGSARAGNAANNFFKLPEWLQVEVSQAFADSMEITPWYRFPFGRVLKLYFSVFAQEVGVVAQRQGYAAALASEGFVTDLVPGIAMAAMFAQLALLAWPLRLALGDENPTGLYVEQLLVAAPTGVDFRALDSRVLAAREVAPGIYVLDVPTFKPLTLVLQRMASALPAAVVLQVSNHAALQVKVIVPAAASVAAAAPPPLQLLAQLGALHGCSELFRFEMPPVGGAELPPTQVALAVEAPALLSLLRFTLQRGLDVQVYDFN